MTSLTSNQFTILFKCFIRSIGSSHNSLPDSTCCTDPAISLNPAGCEPAMNNLIINQCHNVRISHCSAELGPVWFFNLCPSITTS